MGCEFFGGKIIFPSALVPGINNDQSLNCKISLIGSIFSVKNERSYKNGGLKRIMVGPSHAHLLYVHIFVLYSVSQKSDPSFKLK